MTSGQDSLAGAQLSEPLLGLRLPYAVNRRRRPPVGSPGTRPVARSPTAAPGPLPAAVRQEQRRPRPAGPGARRGPGPTLGRWEGPGAAAKRAPAPSCLCAGRRPVAGRVPAAPLGAFRAARTAASVSGVSPASGPSASRAARPSCAAAAGVTPRSHQVPRLFRARPSRPSHQEHAPQGGQPGRRSNSGPSACKAGGGTTELNPRPSEKFYTSKPGGKYADLPSGTLTSRCTSRHSLVTFLHTTGRPSPV